MGACSFQLQHQTLICSLSFSLALVPPPRIDETTLPDDLYAQLGVGQRVFDMVQRLGLASVFSPDAQVRYFVRPFVQPGHMAERARDPAGGTADTRIFSFLFFPPSSTRLY